MDCTRRFDLHPSISLFPSEPENGARRFGSAKRERSCGARPQPTSSPTKPPATGASPPPCRHRLAGEHNLIGNAANTAALLFAALPELNWDDFLKNGALIVDPFQRKLACVRIALGRGVCGTAAAAAHARCRRCTRVPQPHRCDVEARAEIVVPLLRGGDSLLRW